MFKTNTSTEKTDRPCSIISSHTQTCHTLLIMTHIILPIILMLLHYKHFLFSLSVLQCSDTDGVCPLRCDSFDIACYVIDNNGFVLISKQQSDAARFFGEVDGSVMTTLIRMGMFKR
ncbi:hypothetical protein FQN60_005705 [Etheostoma spectabile]|uniref:Voltage-dependent calcium channel alpha-2/delta subunit conserved region domain-containing protein n=1 Tax=Etheostoma spectabile TaxID=54343 RepID=A0A5J5CIW8_9PERO|nr:hypothetical protein FQN60_005705 [Etheostoma spectabile]